MPDVVSEYVFRLINGLYFEDGNHIYRIIKIEKDWT